MSLITPRLTLRPATLRDAPFFNALLNTPTWITNIHDKGIRTDEAAAEYIEQGILRGYLEYGFGMYVMELTSGTPIGICGFVQRDYLPHPDLGFAILPDYERQGYTYEAARAMLDYGYRKLGFTKVLAITTEDNIGSRRLLEKLGMTYVGTIQPSGDDTVFWQYAHGGEK